jgi:hypothetical protein
MSAQQLTALACRATANIMGCSGFTLENRVITILRPGSISAEGMSQRKISHENQQGS